MVGLKIVHQGDQPYQRINGQIFNEVLGEEERRVLWLFDLSLFPQGCSMSHWHGAFHPRNGVPEDVADAIRRNMEDFVRSCTEVFWRQGDGRNILAGQIEQRNHSQVIACIDGIDQNKGSTYFKRCSGCRS